MNGASDPCHVLIAEIQGLHNLLGRVHDALPDSAPVKSMLVDEYTAMINQYGVPTNVSHLLSRASLNRLHQQRQFFMQQELLAHQLYLQQQLQMEQQEQQILLMQQQLQLQRQQQSAFMVQPHQQEKPMEPPEAKSVSTPVPAHTEPIERPTEHVLTSFPPSNNVRKLSEHQLRIRYEQSRQFERMIRQDQADKETEARRQRVRQMSQSSPRVKKRVKLTVTPMTPACFDEPPTPMTPLSPFTPMTEILTPDTDF